MDCFLGANTGTPTGPLHVLVGLVLVDDARLDVIVPLLVQDVLDGALGIAVEDRAQDLHPIVQVAGHQVGRTDHVTRVAPVVEHIHPRMLEETIDNTDRLDVLRYTLHTRPQGAHTAHDQADLHTGLAGLVQLGDQHLVDQIIALERHAGPVTGARVGDFLFHQAQQPRTHRMWRHQQQPVVMAPVVVLEKVEDVEQVLAHILVVGEQREVGIHLRGFLVEIAGAHVAVIATADTLLALDQQQLAVYLKALDAEYHIDAAVRQALGPADIGGLVEARGQLHHRQHPLAVVHGIHQCVDDARIPRNPVQADLYIGHLRVQRRGLEQVDDIGEGMVGVI